MSLCALSPRLVTPFTMLSGCLQGLVSIFWWSAIAQLSTETYSQVR